MSSSKEMESEPFGLVQVNRLRKEVDQLLVQKIEDPSCDISNSRVVDAMLKLLVHDGF